MLFENECNITLSTEIWFLLNNLSQLIEYLGKRKKIKQMTKWLNKTTHMGRSRDYLFKTIYFVCSVLDRGWLKTAPPEVY